MKLSKLTLAATFAVAAFALSGTAANAQVAYTLGGGGANLISFNLATPTVTTTLNLTVAGGGPNDQLDAIDFRTDGTLYGYNTNNDQVYSVNTTTGVITAVGGSATGTTQATTTPDLGIDFNPTTGGGTAAQFRIVTGNSENRVFNVTNGVYSALNPPTPGGPTALTFSTGGAASVNENAYTNNFIGAAASTQYVLVRNGGVSNLYTLNNNPGVLTLVGALGVNLNPGSVGFDIYTDNAAVNFAYAVLQDANNVVPNASSLYTINLGTGTATLVSAIGVGQTGLNSLAVTPVTGVVVPEAGTLQLALGALALVGAVVIRRRK